MRKLRYFLAVADELSFGRAARRLHIAQPVLTRQIRALEADLGVTLFERSSRGTTLTAAGSAIRDDTRALLRGAQTLRRRARRSARSTDQVAIGFMPGILLTTFVRALRRRFPDLAVDVVRTSWDDQVDVVHDGRADLSFVRLPIQRRGLDVVPLYSEPRVAVLSRDHPLATEPQLTLENLADVPLLQDPAAVPELLGTPAAKAARPTPTVEEKLERTAIEGGLVILPESTAQFYRRADVVLRDVEGLAASEVALIRTRQDRSPILDAAMEIARTWPSIDTRELALDD